MPSEFLIVANPVSGRRKAPALAETVLAGLRAAGRDGELTLTEGPGDAQRIAAEAVAAGVKRVVACGGDGTLQEVASAVANTSTAMGILPGGRCNDLAGALELPSPKEPEALTAVLLQGAERKIDLGLFEGAAAPSDGSSALSDGSPESRGGERIKRHFCTVATLGFDTEVSRFVEQNPLPIKGTAAYLYGVLKMLSRFTPPRVRLRGDFGEFKGRILLAATANAPFYGGSMRIAPGALLDDGLFHVCLVKEVPKATILSILPKVLKGRHITHPAVRMLPTSRIEIETPDGPQWICADGETLGQTPARMEILPGALRVLVKAPAGAS